jgi:hypothetical protein
MATWEDAPHLSKAERDELWASIPPHQRDARSKGIPQLGSGAIYPVLESEITVNDFKIPEYWPVAYALDVGWNKTAAVWLAWDRQTDTVYLWSEYYKGNAEPVIHAQGIKARGDWMPGVVDPASRGRNQKDGTKLFDEYRNLGLYLFNADNAVEAGIYKVWMRLSTGRLKVFKSLQNWLAEYRIYRRDEDGKVVKDFDHLMDCTRYGIATGLNMAITRPFDEDDEDLPNSRKGASEIGGY